MSDPESTTRDRTRWSLVVSADVDRAVRRYLGERGGRKGDLSALVETAVNARLFQEVVRETKLRNALRPLRDSFDVILIDCQPSLGLLTVNALTAAHGVLIPLECEFFALRGVALLVETIDKVRDRLNPAIELDGILATMYDARTLHSREVLERVVETFGDQVLETVIGRTVKFPDASVAGAPITSFAPDHSAADSYRQLARELISRGAVA